MTEDANLNDIMFCTQIELQNPAFKTETKLVSCTMSILELVSLHSNPKMTAKILTMLSFRTIWCCIKPT